MNVDIFFSYANSLALFGWIVLLGSPFAPKLANLISGQIIPFILAVGYTGLVLAFWADAQGGFDTLPNVMALFDTRETAFAGWVHFLAFDLFVGAWVVRVARRERIPFLLVIPCLAFTFLFGPAGFLMFMGLRAAWIAMPNTAEKEAS